MGSCLAVALNAFFWIPKHEALSYRVPCGLLCAVRQPCTPTEICSSWKQSGLPFESWWSATFVQHHFRYSNSPSQDTSCEAYLRGRSLVSLAKNLFRFIHNRTCFCESFSLYLPLQNNGTRGSYGGRGFRLSSPFI